MSFWDTVRGAVEVVGRVIPPCHVCGAPGAQVCMVCQQVGCHRHSYSNIGAARSVCSPCLATAFPWASEDLYEVVPGDWPYEDFPWEILEVSPNASDTEINKAYREASKLHHPDHSGSDEQQVALNRARDAMLRKVA